VCGAISLPALCVHAQVAAAAPAAAQFEVASIRVSPAGENGLTSFSGVGMPRFAATNVSLPLLMQIAFGVDEYQIIGRPKWMDSARYDISAKPEGEANLTYDRMKPLLQNLLIQRFHLVVHRETKEFKGYGVVVAKGGLKLPASKGDAGANYILQNGLRLSNIDMPGIASALGRATGRPMVDRTGVPGRFDVKLDYAPDNATDSSLPSLFTAVQEQLGLKLEAQQVPVEMLVIDRVDRIPTEN
jgi:uncharacterized protein (TIGR03435 family)